MSRFQRLMRDRRALGIAAIVGAVFLLVIAGVLAVTLLSSQPEIGGASQTPSPSVSPERPEPPQPSLSGPAPTPTPTPLPMALDTPLGATVLVNDLNVRETPGDGAPVTSVDAGDVVLMNGEPQEIDGIDWYPVMASGTTETSYGWISAGPDDDPYLELQFPFAQSLPARIEGMAGSDAGYLAWGFNARDTTEQPTRFLAVSADGSSWELTEAPATVNGAAFVDAGHGPSGWLLVTSNHDNTGPGEVWRSADGLSWQQDELGLPNAVLPHDLVGFAGGYALAAWEDPSSGTSTEALYTSSDGTHWEVNDGSQPSGLALESLDDGFIASGEGGGSIIVRTGNAQGWTSEATSLPGVGPRVVSSSDTVLAVAANSGSGPVQAWRSSLDLAAWERVPQLEAILVDISLGYLVASDDWIVLAGQEYADGAEQWWRSSDGVAWERIAPAGLTFSELMGPMATGVGGFSFAASERTAAGLNTLFVTSPDAATWTPASDSALPIVDSPVVGSCPGAPQTMLQWMATPGLVGAECFGSSAVTFAAWNTEGGGCGGFAPGRFEPQWLASPFATFALIIAPMETPAYSCGSAVVTPGTDVPAVQQWVAVTGHWDDPAAADCRSIPQPDYRWGDTGSDLVPTCQARFAATSVTPTSAP